MEVVNAITGVFTNIAGWITNVIPTVTAVFYAEGQLTFLGVLAVCGLAVSIFFLIMGLVQNFLHFRG